MATINISIRMDKELKKQFEDFCDKVGMSMSAAFTLFARKTVAENKIPFQIEDEIPNETTKRAIENARNGIGLSSSFSSVEELMKDLET